MKKTLIEVCRPHLYASFGTFCVQIGQLFLAGAVCLRIFGRIRNQRHFLSKNVICRCSSILQSFFFYFFHFLIHSIQNSEMKIFPSRKLRKVELEQGKKNLLQKMFLIHLEADFSFLQIFLHGPFLMWEFFNVIDLTCEICWTLKCCSTGKWSLENVKYQMCLYRLVSELIWLFSHKWCR